MDRPGDFRPHSDCDRRLLDHYKSTKPRTSTDNDPYQDHPRRRDPEHTAASALLAGGSPGSEFCLQKIGIHPCELEEGIEQVFYILFLIVGFSFAWRFIQNFFTWYGKEISFRTSTDLDEQLMPFFRRVALIILALIAIIALLGHFEGEVGTLITTLGISSLTIALAGQAAFFDTISGFIIMVDRPFRIGDRIEIQDLDTWWDVVDIGLRSSRIRTRDNRMVILPNSVIGKSQVVNYSYPDTQSRIQIHIGIAYESDLEKARKVMVETVQKVEGVLEDKAVEALFLEFGESALIFRVLWWIDSYLDTRRMSDKVNSALYKALNEAGVVIRSPQVEVHHRFQPSDLDPSNALFTGRAERVL